MTLRHQDIKTNHRVLRSFAPSRFQLTFEFYFPINHDSRVIKLCRKTQLPYMYLHDSADFIDSYNHL